MSLTGREGRMILGTLTSSMTLPLPFHRALASLVIFGSMCLFRILLTILFTWSQGRFDDVPVVFALVVHVL